MAENTRKGKRFSDFSNLSLTSAFSRKKLSELKKFGDVQEEECPKKKKKYEEANQREWPKMRTYFPPGW